MGIVELIAQLAGLANRIMDKIDDPAARAKARREYEDGLFALKDKVLQEQDAEKRSQLLECLLAAIHTK